ncbi:MAG TPA: hypothetical protein VMV69_07330 [Pirellulales bacterium]|nr:hypothetical protein [Pirellulales bacterium]
MSCKFTGWLAVAPYVFWVATFGDRRAARTLAIGVPVAAMAFWAVNPPLWHQPLAGLEKFFELNLSRADHAWLNIPTTYFGARYDARTPLPWHNSLVWTAITVPVGTLALFGVGLGRALRNWRARPEWMLLVGHWAVLVVVRATPFAPPHDAERLFLPSFAFLAMLAGLGGEALLGWTQRGGSMAGWLGRGALAVALAGSMTSTMWYAPQWLSYYNLLVGGLRGANALGMEPTYYWDGLDAEVLAWLDEHTADDEKIAFASSSPENWELMRQWGSLRVACFPAEPGRYRWYVIQRRPSTLSDAERRLTARGRPALRKTIRRPGAGWGPWRLDVPIVEVYDYAEYERALVLR